MRGKSEDTSNKDSSVIALMNCVFPDGLHEEALLPLMYVLKDEMSFRSVAHVIGLLTNKSEPLLLTSVYHAASPSYKPDVAVVSMIKQRLEECGYREWLLDV